MIDETRRVILTLIYRLGSPLFSTRCSEATLGFWSERLAEGPYTWKTLSAVKLEPVIHWLQSQAFFTDWEHCELIVKPQFENRKIPVPLRSSKCSQQSESLECTVVRAFRERAKMSTVLFCSTRSHKWNGSVGYYIVEISIFVKVQITHQVDYLSRSVFSGRDHPASNYLWRWGDEWICRSEWQSHQTSACEARRGTKGVYYQWLHLLLGR